MPTLISRLDVILDALISLDLLTFKPLPLILSILILLFYLYSKRRFLTPIETLRMFGTLLELS